MMPAPTLGAQVLGLVLSAWTATSAPAACLAGQVQVETAPGEVAAFSVEVAATADTRAMGLMFRRAMPSAAGMLFVYPEPRQVWFWMKNTYLPLDMIFADARGVVTRVQAQAKPLDETPIDGGDNVRFVLEINAGLAERLGIGPGDRMRAGAMQGAGPLAWPCAE